MKLVFDNIIFSLQKSGGISVYWFELISRFLKEHSSQCDFIEAKGALENVFRKNTHIPAEKIVKQNSIIPIQLIRYLPIPINTSDTAIFHSGYYRVPFAPAKKFKQVLTVHDFTYEKFTHGLKREVHTAQKRVAIKAADIIICVSESTRRDLHTYYPECKHKDIRVIYNGVSHDYKPLSNDQKTISSRPFILFVGSRAAYKNFILTVDLISGLNEYDLVLTGNHLSDSEKALLEIKLKGRYRIYPGIANEELNTLFNSAYCLLYPSLFEGFGIPVLEAMRAGCPVIALNNSSLPEVCGKAGILLESADQRSLSSALGHIQDNREKIISAGYLQAAQFSWDKCYEETIKIYKELGLEN
ncbi:MAG TPA: glycosyltransferase family 1 protein [Pedobacter sp.]|jgi:mannosyltransferase